MPVCNPRRCRLQPYALQPATLGVAACSPTHCSLQPYLLQPATPAQRHALQVPSLVLASRMAASELSSAADHAVAAAAAVVAVAAAAEGAGTGTQATSISSAGGAKSAPRPARCGLQPATSVPSTTTLLPP